MISNQNFFLQNGRGIQTSTALPVPPRKMAKATAGPDGSRARGMPVANPDIPAAARKELGPTRGGAIIGSQPLVGSAKQRLSAPAGFTYAYPKSGNRENEMESAYAQENIARTGRGSVLSLDDGPNPSLVSQPAATRPREGRNRPIRRLIAPEAVPPARPGTLVHRQARRHRSATPEQGRRTATPPAHPRQISQTPLFIWNPPLVNQ